VYEDIGPRIVVPNRIKTVISISFNQIAGIGIKRYEAAIGGKGRRTTRNRKPRTGAIFERVISGNAGLFTRATNRNSFGHLRFQVANEDILEAVGIIGH